MALGGGTFTKTNKVLPGAYHNFASAQKARRDIGERGTVAIGLELNWGEDGKIFEVTAEQFFKNSLNIFGYGYASEEMKKIREVFKNAVKGYFYKLNTNGAKATNKFGTARYEGTRGNDLQVVISKNVDDETKYDVTTLLGTTKIETQTVTSTAELVDNDYIVFKKDAELEVTAGIALTGGTNGTVTGESHQSFLNKLEVYSFNTLGCTSKEADVISLYIAYTKRMRDEQGVKFQTIVYNTKADYEGVINVKNKTEEDELGLIYWVTGASAGCAINQSNTNKKYDGEYTVVADYTQVELAECITGGELVLHRVGDEIRVLTDINSLVQTTDEKGEDFKSNQSIRVLDQFSNDTASIFNNQYLGKIQNNDAGRVSLWNSIVTLCKEYEAMGAIEDFNSEEVTIGAVENDKKSVVVNSAMKPLNAIEKLYMSTVVG